MQQSELATNIYNALPELTQQDWETCSELPHELGHVIERIADNWQEKLGYIIDELTSQFQVIVSIEDLRREIITLKKRCEIIERTSPLIVPIDSMAPEPYEVVNPFHVVVRLEDEQYIASFFDANLSASGDTQQEAVFNLKDIIIGSFEILTMTNKSKLGPGPAQQRAVLEKFIRKTK